MRGAFGPGARRVEMVGRKLKACIAEANTRVCAIRREGAGETDILRTVEENEGYKFGVWLGVRSSSPSASWEQKVYSEHARSEG